MKLLTWMKQHPVKSAPLLFGIGGIIGTVIAGATSSDEWNCACLWIPATISLGLIIGGLVSMRGMIVGCLMLSLVVPIERLNANEPPPPSQTCALGPVVTIVVVVLVVGGISYVTYKIVRACQRLRHNQDERERQRRRENGEDDQASKRNPNTCGTCARLADGSEPIRTYFRSHWVMMDKPTLMYFEPAKDLIASDVWNADIANEGLNTGYSINGRPAEEGESRWIVWDANEFTHTVLNGTQRFHLQSTLDLKNWVDVIDAWLPIDAEVDIDDSADGNAIFYRVVNGGVE